MAAGKKIFLLRRTNNRIIVVCLSSSYALYVVHDHANRRQQTWIYLHILRKCSQVTNANVFVEFLRTTKTTSIIFKKLMKSFERTCFEIKATGNTGSFSYAFEPLQNCSHSQSTVKNSLQVTKNKMIS